MVKRCLYFTTGLQYSFYLYCFLHPLLSISVLCGRTVIQNTNYLSKLHHVNSPSLHPCSMVPGNALFDVTNFSDPIPKMHGRAHKILRTNCLQNCEVLLNCDTSFTENIFWGQWRFTGRRRLTNLFRTEILSASTPHKLQTT